jgi:hypothetical protein
MTHFDTMPFLVLIREHIPLPYMIVWSVSNYRNDTCGIMLDAVWTEYTRRDNTSAPNYWIS